MIADKGMKLNKVTKKNPCAPPGGAAPGHPPPTGLTATVLPPTVPGTIPEEEEDGGVLTPVGHTATVVVDTVSVSLGASFNWCGA